jgi:deferrochelatase/peroxidase EfeB
MAEEQIHLELPLPEPFYSSSYPYQSGITDPMWPAVYPDTIEPAARDDHLKQKMQKQRLEDEPVATPYKPDLRSRYQSEYAGRVARQTCQHILRANITARSREELRQTLILITQFIREEMERKPSVEHVAVFEPVPESYRVTITLGLGASLFVDATGYDRFGLRSRKPKFLKPMPSFDGDAHGFHPSESASDLIFVIASDHPYVNVAIVRFFAEHFNRRFSDMHHAPDKRRPVLSFRQSEDGFARKDKREFLRFDDGIQNLQMSPRELRRLVYVDEADHEPDWCLHGSYLVYRKIRERMPVWEVLDAQPERQEAMIGRKKLTGKPLSRQCEGHDGMIPVYPDPTDAADGPLEAHIRKVQPRRPVPDLFGLNDLERQFLRRPYPFFDGLDGGGEAVNGLHFMAFMKSIQRQFEHIVNMWQMNPDFPVPGTGVDALYASGVLSTVEGGYYFCPPGLHHERDFLGSGLFENEPNGGQHE